MAVSMTGFGRAEITLDNWTIKVEFKSVNHRYLDVNIRLPRTYQVLEETILQLVKDHVSRGRVEIYLTIEELVQRDRTVKIDAGIVRGLVEQWTSYQAELKLPELNLEQILQVPDVIRISDQGIELDELQPAVTEAVRVGLEQLNNMRHMEGDKLTTDLVEKLNLIEQYIVEIETYAPDVVNDYRQRLQERMQDLLSGTSLTEERFVTEVALFADRSSIDEELVRLHSHIQQFNTSLRQDGVVGRKLDFLIQEMNREVNTIGSKANDLRIAKLVVELKSELERLREQVQNLE